MCNMCKEGRYLIERIIHINFPAKPRIRLQSIQKRRPGVEVLSGTACIGLINNPIKESLCHNSGHRDITTRSRRRITRTGLAAGAAVVIAGATVAPSAAAQASVTAAVLSQHGPRKGSGEESDDKDC